MRPRPSGKFSESLQSSALLDYRLATGIKTKLNRVEHAREHAELLAMYCLPPSSLQSFSGLAPARVLPKRTAPDLLCGLL